MKQTQERLPFYRLQMLRIQNVDAALERDDLWAEDVVTLFGVAHKGLQAAISLSESGWSDAQDFLGLEERVRDRLDAMPTGEVMRVAISAGHAVVQAELDINL